MICEIINIGDELLIGQVVNTNCSYMAKIMNSIGIDTKYISTIADDGNDIKNSINLALDRADIVLITGGLGPTKDDITKSILNELFGGKLVLNKRVDEHVRRFFAMRNMPYTPTNRSQAMVPDCCQVIFNEIGTAPGMMFEKDSKVIISMPGVPFEMRNMMTKVKDIIMHHFNPETIIYKTLVVSGIAESFLSDKLEEFENHLRKVSSTTPAHYSIAYLPNAGLIRLRLSAKGGYRPQTQKQVDEFIKELRSILKNNIVGEDEDSLAKIVGNKLKSLHKTLSTAESCTGGNIAHQITLVSGASEYFMGGVVSYTNDIKNRILCVDKSDIDTLGAVSEEVCRQMALGVMNKFQTDYALATTGLAGPNSDGTETPVGTVYMAVCNSQGHVEVKKSCFITSRENFIDRVTNHTLFMLLEILSKQ